MEISNTMLKSAVVGMLTGGSIIATVIQNKYCPESTNSVKNEYEISPKTDVVELSKNKNDSIINNKNLSIQKAEQPKVFENLLHCIKK